MTKDNFSVDIINARVPGYYGLQQIKVDQYGIIAAITAMDQATTVEVIDVAGDWVTLGGVDLQINGGLGLAFPDLSISNSDQLMAICQYLWQQGVDAFLPTIVTTSVEKIQRSLSIIADLMIPPLIKPGLGRVCKPGDPPQPPLRRGENQVLVPLFKGDLGGSESDSVVCRRAQEGIAQILGVHLEGPFLNFQKRGAHPAEYLLPLTLENVKQVLGDYAHVVKVITLAPELDVTDEVIPYLHSLGITVSLGHSQATAIQAEKAFKLGAPMVTHAFNAMPSLHHREPGLLGAALINPNIYCGFIADGQHICPTMIQLLLSAGGYEKGLFLVSDALAPIGLADGVYPWDTRQIEVINGTARLADGTLSGTTLPLLVGVQNLVRWGVCGVETAISLATEAPRKAIGLAGISVGESAHLLRWSLEEETNNLSWQRLIK
jgi:N-acetylglucosamine-6-phosphate deacetylase